MKKTRIAALAWPIVLLLLSFGAAGSAKASPSVLFLVDQGGGMANSCGAQDCWSALQSALEATIPAYASSVDFGLALFGSDGTPSCPQTLSIAPAPGTTAAIVDLMAGSAPEYSEKPLADAITSTVPLLTTAGGPRALIAIFRGVPDTCAQPSPNQGEAAAIASAQAAFALGVRTKVVSIGTIAPAAFLQNLANAGAGLPIGGATNASFFVVGNAAEMADALALAIEEGSSTPVPTLEPLALGLLGVALAGLLSIAAAGFRARIGGADES